MNVMGSMETYNRLSLAEQAIARYNFGDDVDEMIYDFRNMRAKNIEDGTLVQMKYNKEV